MFNIINNGSQNPIDLFLVEQKFNTKFIINIQYQLTEYYNVEELLDGYIYIKKKFLYVPVDQYVRYYIHCINCDTNFASYFNSIMYIFKDYTFTQKEKYSIIIAKYISDKMLGDLCDFSKALTKASNKGIKSGLKNGECPYINMMHFTNLITKYKRFKTTIKDFDYFEISKVYFLEEYNSRIAKNLFVNLDKFLDEQNLTSIFKFLIKLWPYVDMRYNIFASFNMENNYKKNREKYMDIINIVEYHYFQKSFFEGFDNTLIKDFSKQDQDNIMMSLYIKQELPKNKKILENNGPLLFEILLNNNKITLGIKNLARVNKYFNYHISKFNVEFPCSKAVTCFKKCNNKIFMEKGTIISSQPICAQCLNLKVYDVRNFDCKIINVWCRCEKCYHMLFFHTNKHHDYSTGKLPYIGGNPKCEFCRIYC